MAISTARDSSGKKQRLGAVTVSVFLLIADNGPEGAYPGSQKVADMLAVRRNSVQEAEVILTSLGLVKFTTGQSRRYEISAFKEPDSKQLKGLKALIDAQSSGPPAVVPTPEVEQAVPAEAADQPMIVPAEAACNFRAPEPVPEVVTVPQAAAEEIPNLKIKAVKLTPDAIAWFTEKPENMDLYLRFGSGACGLARAVCESTLKSSPTDWLAFKPANEIHPDTREWKATHHMGYYWHGVCMWRAQNGINLTMPQMGRLAGTIAGILKTMTADQTHLYMFNALYHFELAQFRIGRLGEGMILDEATLAHSLVRTELLQMNSHGHPWVVAEYDRMRTVKELLERQRERDNG
jgi:hypothetical protein